MTTHTLDPVLVALAADQQGMLTTRQTAVAGLSAFSLTRLVKAGDLLHPGRGLYAVTSLVDQSPESWHRHLMHGALLLYPDAVFTGVSALLAHDVRIWNADLSRPQILRPVHRGSSVSCVHLRPERPGPVVQTELGPTVAVAAALVQHAIDSGIAPGLVSMDHALHESRVEPSDLEMALRNVALWPLSSRARSAVRLADGRRESAGESRTAVALALAGVDVTPQVEIHDKTGRLIGRADFLVAETNVIIEFDGKLKYASGDQEVLWAEKKREDAFRRAGYLVVRITWSDLERPGGVAAKVRQALFAA